MAESLLTLLMLVLLQAVLGFDNLLYISLESKKAPEDKQGMVRKWGIGLAIALRLGLLFVLMHLIKSFQNPFLELDNSFVSAKLNLHSLIVILGGGFILYTAVKDIWHMMSMEHDEEEDSGKKKSTVSVIAMIVIMNLVFSIDSILSAMALTDVFWIMATAIIASGLLMIWLSDRVANFLKKNRMYEVLGLFVLFIVGIMLITEGGHLGHLAFMGNEIHPMTKTTFYFVLAILVIVEIVQGRYQRKLDVLDEEEGESEEEMDESEEEGDLDEWGKPKKD